MSFRTHVLFCMHHSAINYTVNKNVLNEKTPILISGIESLTRMGLSISIYYIEELI